MKVSRESANAVGELGNNNGGGHTSRKVAALRWLTVSLAIGAAVGCGASVAPPMLHSARDAYARAEKSEVPKVVPVKLEEAKQALTRADQAFEDGEDEETVDALSYIAERKAELAMSVANQEIARKQTEEIAKEKTELQAQALDSTQKQLTAAQEDRRRLDEAAKKGDAEVARVKGDLEKERVAREAAEKKAAAAMASLAEIAKVREESRGMVITLSGSVLFTTGNSQLLPIAKEKLAEVAKAIKDQGYKKIVVEGHTDSRGAPTKNEALSLQRAQEVRSFLISQGIEMAKIEALGHGSRNPVAENDSAEGRANNRRVEIVVTPD